MQMSKTWMPTLRDVPADAVIVSHKLMLRSGMIRKLSNGLYAYLPMGLRSFRKVENIIREEMDRIGVLELKPTVIVPGELWKESGRFETFGAGMLCAKNRLGADLVVSPTAEEVFTHLVRSELSSYKQLPLTLYQINTKYRDEVRPRYGVMRGREFMMFDAYSYHTDDGSLDATYQDMARAYRRIFKRCGLTVIAVKADTGAMGGTGSEEFMVESEVGDNTLILCSCGYAANVEKASCRPDWEESQNAAGNREKRPERIATPNVRTIEELTSFLKTTPKAFIKTLIYQASNVEAEPKPDSSVPEIIPRMHVAVLIRGDLDVNETKLAALLKASEVELASNEDVERITNAPVGFAGPVGLSSVKVIADETVMHMHDAVTGANAGDTHLIHVEPGRDFVPFRVADLRVVKTGDACISCGKPLYEKKGNELGHIFKLGYKYTESMHVTYLDENGREQRPTMGCYGIGVDRTLASIIEEHHDDDGIIWPVSVAPYHVAVVPIQFEGAMKAAALSITAELEKLGVEVLLDDREERPGVKFKDMDLIGIPYKIIVGEKNLPANVELKDRKTGTVRLVPVGEAAQIAAAIIKDELSLILDRE
ncbi:MAG TPA: proline--tRNA ligase [Spirochaetia bacterium]|nr:proline--tRNA ligase [Spirochaetia bacterium]